MPVHLNSLFQTQAVALGFEQRWNENRGFFFWRGCIRGKGYHEVLEKIVSMCVPLIEKHCAPSPKEVNAIVENKIVVITQPPEPKGVITIDENVPIMFDPYIVKQAGLLEKVCNQAKLKKLCTKKLRDLERERDSLEYQLSCYSIDIGAFLQQPKELWAEQLRYQVVSKAYVSADQPLIGLREIIEENDTKELGQLMNRYRFVKHPNQGDLVLYYNEEKVVHGGFLNRNGNVESDWGKGKIYVHYLFPVPEKFGNKACFLRARTEADLEEELGARTEADLEEKKACLRR